jgi:putative ABC transport system ATP-binding protein
MSDFLRVENVEQAYRTGDTFLQVLKGVSLNLVEGEILAIVGPSGSGKSTLLHLMGFLDTPTAGEDVPGRNSPRRTPRSRRTSATTSSGSSPDVPPVAGAERARKHVGAADDPDGDHDGSPRPAHRRRAKGSWRGWDWGRLHHRPHQLSGGERQRVPSRALIGDPEVVFCDEPTGNLDAAPRARIQELITRLSKETKKTFVIVSHDPAVATLAGRVIRLIDGRISG